MPRENNAVDAQTVDARYAPLGILLLRVMLGVMWIAHAFFKIIVFSVPGFAQWLGSLGLPSFMGGPVVALELAIGLAILTGFYGRLATIASLPILAVIVWVHAPNGWVFINQGGGWEYPVFLIGASLVYALLGDGAYAARKSRVPFLKAAAAAR